jgi:hypothetical protein
MEDTLTLAATIRPDAGARDRGTPAPTTICSLAGEPVACGAAAAAG